MSIICDIRAQPHRTPEELCRRHKVSKRQFYKDRDTLAEMGFTFHFDRSKDRFVLEKDFFRFNVRGLSLADLFALILAVKELTRLSDFGLAQGALSGLRSLVDSLPDEMRAMFGEAVDEVVIEDAFQCAPQVLNELTKAVEERRKVLLFMSGPNEDRPLDASPRRLFLKDGRLFLEAEGLDGPSPGLVALSRVHRVEILPLFKG